MEKIREFIHYCKEIQEIRKESADYLMDSSYNLVQTHEASNLINKMLETGDKAGVLSFKEKDGKIRIQVRFEKYLEITSEANRKITSENESEHFETTHFETIIEGIEITSVRSIWKKEKMQAQIALASVTDNFDEHSV